MKDLFYILKTYVYLLPPIQILVLVVLATIELTTSFKFSQTLLFDIGFNMGNSTFTLLVYVAFFFNPKLRYCLFTRCMVVGLILNQFLYYLSFFIPNEYYQKLYTITAFAIAIVCYWIYLLMPKKEE